jgi:hypothetical protein
MGASGIVSAVNETLQRGNKHHTVHTMLYTRIPLYEFFDVEDRWTKHVMARDVNGNKISPTHRKACKFHIRGAYFHLNGYDSFWDEDSEMQDIREEFEAKLLSHIDPDMIKKERSIMNLLYSPIVLWNDSSLLTFKEFKHTLWKAKL